MSTKIKLRVSCSDKSSLTSFLSALKKSSPIGDLSNRDIPNICNTSYADRLIIRSLSMIATKQYDMTAQYICILTAFSEVPQKDLIFKCCLIHLKNNSNFASDSYKAKFICSEVSSLLVR